MCIREWLMLKELRIEGKVVGVLGCVFVDADMRGRKVWCSGVGGV